MLNPLVHCGSKPTCPINNLPRNIIDLRVNLSQYVSGIYIFLQNPAINQSINQSINQPFDLWLKGKN